MNKMLNNDQVSSIIWFAIGVIIIYASSSYELGGVHAPGTGFMPFLTGAAILLLSIAEFLRSTKEQRNGKKWKSILDRSKWKKPLTAMIALLIYSLTLNSLGFLISTAVLVGFLLRVIYPQKWAMVILGAALTSFLTYLVFQVLLNTQLPKGILGL